jgi:hypothetical protein
MSAALVWRAYGRSMIRHIAERKGILIGVLVMDTLVIVGSSRVFALTPEAFVSHVPRRIFSIAAAIAVFQLFAVMKQSFGDGALLLMTLPMACATRARALFGVVCIESWNLWILLAMSFLIAAIPRIGTAAAVLWFALFLLLLALAVWIAFSLVLLALDGGLRGALQVASGMLVVAGTGFLLFRATSWHLGAGMTLSIILLSTVCGPGASAIGRRYERAFLMLQARQRRPLRWSWMNPLLQLLTSRRSLAAALITREALSRMRHWFNWARAGSTVAAMFAFPTLAQALARRGIGEPQALAMFVMLLVVMLVIDGWSSPIGAEGDRLALLLTAPLSVGRVLGAKLVAFALPMMAISGAIVLPLAAMRRMSAKSTGEVALFLVMATLALSVLFVFGSAADEELDQEIAPGLHGVLHDEAPLTPIRMLLVTLGSLLVVGLCILLTRYGLLLATASAAAVGLVLMAIGLPFAKHQLYRLRR